MQVIGWIILFIVLLIIEIATLGLTTIWFAGGAIIAAILAALGAPLFVQILLFVVVSVILFVVTRPLAMKYFNKDREKTNTDSLIGESAIVTADIDTIKAIGQVEVKGMQWSAKTDSETGVIKKGTLVRIEGVQGVKLIVREKEA